MPGVATPLLCILHEFPIDSKAEFGVCFYIQKLSMSLDQCMCTNLILPAI